MKTDEMKFEDGCYIIPDKDFAKMLKFFGVVFGAIHSFPEDEVKKAVEKQMERYGISKEDGGDFLILILDLLKLELKK